MSIQRAHYGWSFSRRFLEKMWKAGPLNCLKKYYWISEFKFGDLVGVDKLGNKYYQDTEESFPRDRWVEYADQANPEASAVPAEWHQWLHHITDEPGTAPTVVAMTPKFAKDWRPNPSGTSAQYSPPNYVLNVEYGNATFDPSVYHPTKQDLTSVKVMKKQ
eukprot:TRINITY_DN18986_c0_g1_i1.p1 TRINITY_DN18986_c0_g1~~TRINITY_DN18986_c0_g1_i1.p1  ORF type:complete len:161 (-),score=35.71 TRINITY_DN18986_c0_g1_i1:16-498(-)